MVKLVVTDKDGREVEIDARPGLSIMENILATASQRRSDLRGLVLVRDLPRLHRRGVGARTTAAALRGARNARHVAWFDPERSRLSCQIKVTGS